MGLRIKANGINSIYRRLFSTINPSSRPSLRFIQYFGKNDARRRLGVVSEDGQKFIQLSQTSCVSYDMRSFLQQDIKVGELRQKLNVLSPEDVNDSITLMPPLMNPGKIICVASNYPDNCEEQKIAIPKCPIILSKFNTAVVGPLGRIIQHSDVEHMDWGVSLAVVIGKAAQQVPRGRSIDYIFGYAVAQDITAHDWRKRNGGQFLMSMSMDTFCPFGPCIVHKSEIDNIYDLNMVTCVNGVEKQCGNTRKMLFSIDEIIHVLTKNITLLPGDIILTGTIGGLGAYKSPPERLKVGDVISTHIEHLGSLRNRVIKPIHWISANCK